MKPKKTRTATGRIADEFRSMAVGDVLLFPMVRYNPNSVRSSPAATLARERWQGRRWSVRTDVEAGVVEVARTR